MIDGSSCVVCCLTKIFRDHTYILRTYTLYLDRRAIFSRGPLRVYDLTQGNINTKISQTPQTWFRPIPFILIKDEELTYHGKILSVRYEEGRLRAIHKAICISEHRGRPRLPSDTLRLRIQISL
ncbi:hypothetical protein AU210_014628 [Fusarium oxysporum f. sp. radicis-cucumerinum]|uniref:Uncharacterized protein n=1 Tax=Fusarium oxysporum f. sp. radicis-cucumerinum TaxID=327505 RepID=A0A2H3G3V4_FUSOX|nr:hypothetical protein AU210_014628 [Fusarium oxysporum f. sp. radicis-cucumerinum]